MTFSRKAMPLRGNFMFNPSNTRLFHKSYTNPIVHPKPEFFLLVVVVFDFSRQVLPV